MPRRVFEHLIGIAGIAPDRRCAELRQPEREALARAIKDWRFPQFEVTWAGAMVSGGGVALTEVDPKTMASRRVVGLFFAGETLDLQGDCGGFNLQGVVLDGRARGRFRRRRSPTRRDANNTPRSGRARSRDYRPFVGGRQFICGVEGFPTPNTNDLFCGLQKTSSLST